MPSLLPADPALFAGGHDALDIKLGQVARPGTLADLAPGAVAIVGFPFDEGIRRNAGRPGAALAPEEIRRALFKLNAEDSQHGLDFARIKIIDLGNIDPSASLEAAQNRLGEVVRGAMKAGAVPVVLGGGHETTLGHFHAYGMTPSLKILNIDPHLDIRKAPYGQSTSGNSFRLAMEDDPPPDTIAYTCIGAMPHANSAAYAAEARAMGIAIRWFDEVAEAGMREIVREELEGASDVLASMDIDAVSSAFAPGSSAASPFGLAPRDFFAAAEAFGECPAVKSLDLVEFSPPLDRDGQTAKLCALTLWHFLRGLSRRHGWGR